MPNASFVQSDFRGGRWSLRAQGQVANPEYKRSMNVSQNGMPLFNGAWTRRPGFFFGANTRTGRKAKLLPLAFKFSQPFQLEFTDSFLRAHFGVGAVYTPDTGVTIKSISTANPAVVTVNGALPSTWATGDTVVLDMQGVPCTAPILCNRQFTITVLGTTTFSIADALTGVGVDGSAIAYVAPTLGSPDYIFKILELATPYNELDLDKLRIAQTDSVGLVMHKNYQPQAITVDGQIALAAQAFTDGPYLDIVDGNTNGATPGSTSGTVTFTFDSTTNINNGTGFQSTDVGRHFRFQSGPAAWASGTTYAKGATVSGSDSNIYQSVAGGNIGNNPTTDTGANWILTGQTLVWVWGTISTVTSTTVIAVAIQAPGTPDSSGAGSTLLSATKSTVWQLGLYNDTIGWPQTGAYYEGRLWLAGSVVPNRIDGSVSNKPFVFSPSAPNGTVADSNAIAEVGNGPQQNEFFWMLPIGEGILCGAKAGEWLIRASQLNDPITPTSIQLKRVSDYGCADVEALQTELTVCYVQREQKRLLNYAYYPYGETAGWFADNLAEMADDITAPKIAEIRWQQEPSHWLWARCEDGSLIGTTFEHAAYGKNSYNGWHTHALGGSRTVESISTGPTFDGVTTTLYAIVLNSATGYREFLALSPLFDSAVPDSETNFVDGTASPCCAVLRSVAGGDSFNGITIYGMYNIAGQRVAPVIGGLDLGALVTPNDYVVQSDGRIDIPYSGAFTLAFLTGLSDGTDYGVYTLDLGNPDTTTYASDAIGGYIGPTTNFSSNAAGQGFIIQAKNWFVNVNLSGVRVFNLTTFVEEKDATYKQMLYGSSQGIEANGLCCYHPLLNSLFFHCGATNRTPIARVDLGTMRSTGSFGVADSSFTSDSTGFTTAFNSMIPLTMNGLPYVAQVGIKSSSQNDEIGILDASKMSFVCAQTIADDQAYLCPGYANSGNFYVLGTVKFGGASTASFNIYKAGLVSSAFNIGQLALTLTKTGTISPANVDATWTHFSGISGLAFDPTDGNVLAFVSTSDAVTNQNYWLKINPTTGAIVWKCAVTYGCPYTALDLSMLQMPTGKIIYMGAENFLSTLDTVAGTESSVAYQGITLGFGAQQYWPERKATICDVQTAYSTPPVALGAAGTSFSGNYALLTAAGPASSASWPPPDQYKVPLSIGTAYTSQGQLLRPDFGPDAGTAQGPAFGKKRRVHWYAAAVERSQTFQIGTDFSDLDDVAAQDSDENAIAQPSLCSGTISSTLPNNYSFDGQIAWQVSRPTPLTITAMGGYIQSVDK